MPAESQAPISLMDDGIPVDSLGAMQGLGLLLAEQLQTGDVLALIGELGAGKTTLARAVIQTMAENSELVVTSPTFTMVQSYDVPGKVNGVWHYDLYRVESENELEELGLEEAMEEGIVLIEWPDIAASWLPVNTLFVRIEHKTGQPEARLVKLFTRSSRWRKVDWEAVSSHC